MSEPVRHDVPNAHPCEPGHGLPRGEYREWVDPLSAYMLICNRCGQGAMADSIENAQEIWNAAHPQRELSDEELAGASAVESLDDVLQGVQRQYLCDEGVHIIQKLSEGEFAGMLACAQCGTVFRQHAAVTITTGMGAAVDRP